MNQTFKATCLCVQIKLNLSENEILHKLAKKSDVIQSENRNLFHQPHNKEILHSNVLICDLPAGAHFHTAFFCSMVDLLLLLELAAIWKTEGKSMCNFAIALLY